MIVSCMIPIDSFTAKIHLHKASNFFQIQASTQEQGLEDVGVVLLAGGTGSRMKANIPKQFLPLGGITVLQHSLTLFLETLPAVLQEQNLQGPAKVVLVVDPQYQSDYEPLVAQYPNFALANPGVERQGSVFNGVNQLRDCKYVAVHDSARPLVTLDEIFHVIQDARTYGAACLCVPLKSTVKESDDGTLVLRTIPRSRLWEIHTPQVIATDLLLRGFEKVQSENWEVTDDVSIVELLQEPVKLTRGEYTNLKITTPEDMRVAEAILSERKSDH